jgi:hypothetical protein
MDHIGTAPDMSRVVDTMIDRVSDRHVQDALREIVAQNERQYSMYCRALEDCVSDIKTTVRSELRSLAAINVCAPPVPLGANQYPEFIQACVPLSSSGQSSPHVASSRGSSQSLSASSSMTDRADIVCDKGHIIGLKCLFCTHYHVIEKSHCQHLDRLLSRLESGESYSGKCVIPDGHWLYLHFGDGVSKLDAARSFIRMYVSHLHSGNDKNIHPDRAFKLVSWLDSFHRQ